MGGFGLAKALNTKAARNTAPTVYGRRDAEASALQWAADWRQNKLTSSEYDETTWSARTWLSFVSQRLSVATQLAAAQEVAEALGLSVAADPRLQ